MVPVGAEGALRVPGQDRVQVVGLAGPARPDGLGRDELGQGHVAVFVGQVGGDQV